MLSQLLELKTSNWETGLTQLIHNDWLQSWLLCCCWQMVYWRLLRCLICNVFVNNMQVFTLMRNQQLMFCILTTERFFLIALLRKPFQSTIFLQQWSIQWVTQKENTCEWKNKRYLKHESPLLVSYQEGPCYLAYEKNPKD